MPRLILEIRNKDKAKLERLEAWLGSALSDWHTDDEEPMRGSEYWMEITDKKKKKGWRQ